MPYFFILPLFVLYVIGMTVAVGLTFVYQPLQWLRGSLARVLLWSSIGFVLSTIAYAIGLIAALRVVEITVGSRPSVVGGILMGAILFVGPFVAAGFGLLGGAAFALRHQWPGRTL
jgi:uncharacterized membrane protein YjfL (UPF0719 family)